MYKNHIGNGFRSIFVREDHQILNLLKITPVSMVVLKKFKKLYSSWLVVILAHNWLIVISYSRLAMFYLV